MIVVPRAVGLLAAALAACLALAPVAAREVPATVVGKVAILTLDPADVPSRQGVTVELVDHTRATKRVRQTDHYGGFRFDDVPPGTYELVGEARSGQRAARLLELAPGQEYHGQLRLANRAVTWAASGLWTVMALLLCGAFCAAVMLYGPSRDRREASAPRSLTIAFLAWIGGFLLFCELAPEMQPCWMEIADPLSMMLSIVLSSCVVVVVVLLQPPWPAATGALLAGLLLSLSTASSELTGPVAWAAIGVGLLLWTTAAGWLLALFLKRQSYVVLTALVVALMDFFLVFWGTTGQIVASEGAQAEFVRSVGLLPWPVIGSDLIAPRVGFGDFLFLAWFLAAALRFELGLVRNYWVLLAAFTIGVVMTQVLYLTAGLAVGLPALPFMSALFLAANWTKLAIEPAEKRQIARFVTLLCVVLVVLGAIRQGRRGTVREEIVIGGQGPQAADLTLPWDWQAVAAAPLDWRIEAQEAVADGVTLAQVAYRAEDVAGRQVTVRGWLAMPAATPAPAILFLHATPRTADRERCLAWARTGYVALSIDWNPASGPAPDSELAAWPERATYEVMPTVDRSLLYHAGAAALRGVAGLAAMPEVKGGVGVMGDGWGGLLALACGVVAEPVDAVVTSQVGWVEGDGGIVGRELSQRTGQTPQRWLASFAPERYAARLTKPLLVLASTNDRYFTLPGVVKLAAVAPTEVKRIVIEPNADHRISPEREHAADHWFDMALRGGPAPLTTPELEPVATDTGLRLSTRGFSQPGSVSATFYVSVGPRGWPGRFWTRLPARRGETGWSAECGVALPATELGVLVEVIGRDGSRTAQFRSYAVDDLGLELSPPPWPSPYVGWPPGPEQVWRVGDDDSGLAGLGVIADSEGVLRLAVDPDRDVPRPVVLETNDVDALRRLGSQAENLIIELEGMPPGPLIVALLQHVDTADELRWEGSATPSGPGQRKLVLPLNELRGSGPMRPADWEAIDTLRLRWESADPAQLAITGVRLSGPPSGAIRPLDGPR